MDLELTSLLWVCFSMDPTVGIHMLCMWDWSLLNSSIFWGHTCALYCLVLLCEDIKGEVAVTLPQFPLTTCSSETELGEHLTCYCFSFTTFVFFLSSPVKNIVLLLNLYLIVVGIKFFPPKTNLTAHAIYCPSSVQWDECLCSNSCLHSGHQAVWIKNLSILWWPPHPLDWWAR